MLCWRLMLVVFEISGNRHQGQIMYSLQIYRGVFRWPATLTCATDGRQELWLHHIAEGGGPTCPYGRGVLQRQNLVTQSKNLRFPLSLNVAVKVIKGKIKAHALNDSLLRQRCQDIDETFEPLLLHAELHWFSKESALHIFVNCLTALWSSWRRMQLLGKKCHPVTVTSCIWHIFWQNEWSHTEAPRKRSYSGTVKGSYQE